MKRRKHWLPCLLFLCFLSAAALATGDYDDPLISRSYLYEQFVEGLKNWFQLESAQKLNDLSRELDTRLDTLELLPEPDDAFAPQYTELRFLDGDLVLLRPFSSFFLLEGSAKLQVIQGEALNLSTGEAIPGGSLLQARQRYFAAEDSLLQIRVYSDTAIGMVDGCYQQQSDSSIPVQEQFLDVEESYWAAPYIWELASHGIVKGESAHSFSPGGLVTRAAFVTILGRLSGIDPADWSSSGFPDVQTEDWFCPYVSWAAAQRLVVGYDDGSFLPNAPITREQMAVLMLRYSEYLGRELPQEKRSAFADEEGVSDWAVDAVCRMRDSGLMNGRDGNCFVPRGTATRAEICAVTSRFSHLLGLFE